MEASLALSWDVAGGDGTLLGVARQIADSHCPLIGVNAGRLGFITDVVLDDMDRVLPAMLAGECSADQRHLLEGVVFRNGQEIFRNVAVNDIGFSHGRAGGMVDFIIYVDGKQMSAQSADGVVCPTPAPPPRGQLPMHSLPAVPFCILQWTPLYWCRLLRIRFPIVPSYCRPQNALKLSL